MCTHTTNFDASLTVVLRPPVMVRGYKQSEQADSWGAAVLDALNLPATAGG